ncbi:MAG: 2-C-methyl-D-erythritol 4-phosphate cytidylyltransferase, chloroplastic-like isoform [Parachlamydiales bacterium]|nr:2-C-methyl-D-erythritol 4-phosphate cytidylyltransferase, chloroplastic-like isoform [Parachlamydiales bacterium]
MYKNNLFTAILLAGGKGLRMGDGLPKQFRPLLGQPLARYSFDFFNKCSEIDEIIVVCEPCYQPIFQGAGKPLSFALPGLRRQDSVYNGLIASSEKAHYICVHDAARPFIEETAFADLLDKAISHGAAALAVPATNTIKRADRNQQVLQTLPRSECWELQTPQVIRRSLFFKAYAHAQRTGIETTDDLSLIEELGEPAVLVKSSTRNLKITTPIDWLLAEQICASN